MPLVPLCMSLCLCWSLRKLYADGLSELVILSLTALPFWLGDVVTLTPPMATLPLTIPCPFCAASVFTRSSVVALVSLSCFSFLLPTDTMLPLHNVYWHRRCVC